jgi:hypothetical protein
VNKIVFKLANKKQKTFNIMKLRKQGSDYQDIENLFRSFLQDYNDEIVDIDFVVDIETVASIIQPETDKLLNGL